MLYYDNTPRGIEEFARMLKTLQDEEVAFGVERTREGGYAIRIFSETDEDKAPA